jgi:hypothetical protein
MVPVDSVEIPRGSTYSGTFREASKCRLRDCHPLWFNFPEDSATLLLDNSHVKGPTTPRSKTFAVWAIALSLATTEAIEFSFISSGYRDDSVVRVRHTYLWIQYVTSEISGSTPV